MVSYDKSVKSKAKELATSSLPEDYKLGDAVDLGCVCKKLGIGIKYDNSASRAFYSSEHNSIVMSKGKLTPNKYFEIAMAIGEKVIDTKNDNAKYAFAVELLLPYDAMKNVLFSDGFILEKVARKYLVPYNVVETREATLYLHGSFKSFKDIKNAIDDFKAKHPNLMDDEIKTINTVKALKNVYGVTCYEGNFEDKKVEASFNSEEKSFVSLSSLPDEKARTIRAICLAKHIMSDAKGEEVSSFYRNIGDPLYNDLDEKKIFDAASELLIADDNFKETAIQYNLKNSYLAKVFRTSDSAILTKLDNNDLLR